MRGLRRIGAVLVLAAGGLLLAAGSASAAEVPTAGASSPAAVVVSPPWWHPKATTDTCATAPDVDIPAPVAVGGATPAQVQGKDISLWQKYGFAGMHWWTYDVGWSGGDGAIGGGIGGCLPDGTALGAGTQTEIGNFIFQGAKNIVSLDDIVMRRAYTSDWLGIFDPFITRAVTSLHDAVFSAWSYIACAVLGTLILMKAYKGQLTDAVVRVGSAVIVFTAAALIFAQPLFLTHTFSEQIDATTGTVASNITGQTGANGSQPLPADAMIATLHNTMIYRVWLEGVFGDADSPTAKKYGPQILADTALTRDEAAGRGTPAFAKLVAAKQADFVKVAEEIKASDPVAYSYLQGKHSEDRGSKAMRAILATAGASPVILAGSIAMMMSKLIAIFVMVASMVFLLGAIIRGSIGVAQLDRVLAGAVTALVWAVALPISMLANDAALNNPKLDPFSSAMILLVVNAGVFLAAKGLAPGFSGVLRRKHAKKGGRWLMAAVQAAAGYFGAGAGARVAAGAPKHHADDVVDAEVLADSTGRHRAPDDDVYAEDWTREPVGARTTAPAAALPDAPVSPSAEDVQTATERDGRTLPPEPRRAPESTEQPGGDEYRPQRHEGGTTVYDIYAGRTAPEDERPARDGEPIVGEVIEDGGGPLALEGSSGGEGSE